MDGIAVSVEVQRAIGRLFLGPAPEHSSDASLLRTALCRYGLTDDGADLAIQFIDCLVSESAHQQRLSVEPAAAIPPVNHTAAGEKGRSDAYVVSCRKPETRPWQGTISWKGRQVTLQLSQLRLLLFLGLWRVAAPERWIAIDASKDEVRQAQTFARAGGEQPAETVRHRVRLNHRSISDLKQALRGLLDDPSTASRFFDFDGGGRVRCGPALPQLMPDCAALQGCADDAVRALARAWTRRQSSTVRAPSHRLRDEGRTRP